MGITSLLAGNAGSAAVKQKDASAFVPEQNRQQERSFDAFIQRAEAGGANNADRSDTKTQQPSAQNPSPQQSKDTQKPKAQSTDKKPADVKSAEAKPAEPVQQPTAAAETAPIDTTQETASSADTAPVTTYPINKNAQAEPAVIQTVMPQLPVETVNPAAIQLTDAQVSGIITEIADRLGIPAENVAEILDRLNLTPQDLLQNANLRAFVRELYGVNTNAELINIPDVKETVAAIKDIIDNALQTAAAKQPASAVNPQPAAPAVTDTAQTQPQQQSDAKAAVPAVPAADTNTQQNTQATVNQPVNQETAATQTTASTQTPETGAANTQTAAAQTQENTAAVTQPTDTKTPELIAAPLAVTAPEPLVSENTAAQPAVQSTQTLTAAPANTANNNAGENLFNRQSADAELAHIAKQADDTEQLTANTSTESAKATAKTESAAKTAKAASPQEIIKQVTEHIKTDIKANISEVRIMLKPESLGELTLKISIERGIVTAQFTAENQRIKGILESSMNELKDALSESGVNVGALSVNVSQGESESMRAFERERQRSAKRISKIIAGVQSEEDAQEATVVTEAEAAESQVSYTA